MSEWIHTWADCTDRDLEETGESIDRLQDDAEDHLRRLVTVEGRLDLADHAARSTQASLSQLHKVTDVMSGIDKNLDVLGRDFRRMSDSTNITNTMTDKFLNEKVNELQTGLDTQERLIH